MIDDLHAFVVNIFVFTNNQSRFSSRQEASALFGLVWKSARIAPDYFRSDWLVWQQGRKTLASGLLRFGILNILLTAL